MYPDPPSPAKYQCALQLTGPEQNFLFLSLSNFTLKPMATRKKFQKWAQNYIFKLFVKISICDNPQHSPFQEIDFTKLMSTL
jgi:hypothetical protein